MSPAAKFEQAPTTIMTTETNNGTFTVENNGGGGTTTTTTKSHAGSNHKPRNSSTPASTGIGTKPTLIEVKQMRFLIMDAPRQGNLHLYMKEMRKHHVTDVVRVCEPTYHGAELSNAGIGLHEMEYKDGTSPSKELIDRWLSLVDRTFFKKVNAAATTDAAAPPCIAVHCVAGLGRAPVMVAIALIEFAGMDPVEVVSLIRNKRRGAVNEKQLLYLEGYKKQYGKGKAGGNGGAEGCCVIL